MARGQASALAPAEPFGTRAQEPVVRHRTFGQAIRRRWRTVLASVGAGAALAGVHLAAVGPRYEATASLRLLPDGTRAADCSPTTTARADHEVAPLATEVAVLRGRGLAADVVDSLGLRLVIERPSARARRATVSDLRVAPGDDRVGYTLRRTGPGEFTVSEVGRALALGTVAVGRPARFGPIELTLGDAAEQEAELRFRVIPYAAAVDRVRRGMYVSDGEFATGVVTLRYQDAEPALAREVLGAYVDRYLGRRRDVQAAKARSTAAGVGAQLDSAGRALAAAERAVREFREREHVIDIREEAAAQVRHVVDLQAQRASIEAEHQAFAALVADVQRERGGADTYRRVLVSPSLSRSSDAANLVRQLDELDAQRAAPFRLTSGTPDPQLLAARDREFGGQVRALAATYLAGLKRQAAATDAQRARIETELARIPGREAELARLQRARDALGPLVDSLRSRFNDARLAQSTAEPGAEVVESPTVSTRPVSPRPVPDLGFGLFAGLVAGSGLAVVRDRRDRSVHTRGDLQDAAGLPVLAAVPVIDGRSAGPVSGRHGGPLRAGLRLLGRGDGARAPAMADDVIGQVIATADPVLDDAYARLYLNMMRQTDSQARSILIASPLPGEGRTITAFGLATSLARRGVRVLLLDADLRRGTLAQDYFGLSPSATGLAELLRGTIKVSSALRVFRLDEHASLTYVSSGRVADRTGVVLDAAAMRTLFTQFTSLFEAVVVDSAPLNVVTDGALLATLTDAVILVGRTGATDVSAVREAAELLRGLGARVVGTLLNAVDARRDRPTRQTRDYYRLADARRPRTLAGGAAPAAAVGAAPVPDDVAEAAAPSRSDVSAADMSAADVSVAEANGSSGRHVVRRRHLADITRQAARRASRRGRSRNGENADALPPAGEAPEAPAVHTAE